MSKFFKKQNIATILVVLFVLLFSTYQKASADEKFGSIVGGNVVCPSGYSNSGRYTTDTIPTPICVSAPAPTITPTPAAPQIPPSFDAPTISGSGSTLTADQLPGGQCSTIGYPVDVKGDCNPGDAIVLCPATGNRCQAMPNNTAGECANGYKPNLDGSCKLGDYKTSCPPKGTLCVAPLVAGGEKITQQLHEYVTKYTLPCQPLAGGQCADDQTPAGYIARLYQFGLMIVGLFAFGGIVYGALKYVLSAGSMADQSDAKDQITQAVLGSSSFSARS